MKILAIESSCDETASAIVANGIKLLAATIASSKEIHEKTGGVVPELAARKQVESIIPVIEQTLISAHLALSDIDGFAVTVGPGLIGSLVVGVAAAKSLAFVTNKPLIPVNHLVGHLYANWVEVEEAPEFPAIGLVISGGHTDLVLMKNHGDLEYLGGTLDDAAGEAFDKTARLLGLKKYLGGVELSNLAATCANNVLQGKLPRPKINDADFDFSFSGLKTATKRLIENKADLNFDDASLAKEFEDSVCDVVCSKVVKAIKQYNAKSFLMGGGVAANKSLRNRLAFEITPLGVSFHVPPIQYCTDNAIYIASAAFFNNKKVPLTQIDANPSLTIMDL